MRWPWQRSTQQLRIAAAQERIADRMQVLQASTDALAHLHEVFARDAIDNWPGACQAYKQAQIALNQIKV